MVALAACPSGPKPAPVAPTPVITDLPNPPPKPEALRPPKPDLRLPRNFTVDSYRVRLAIDPSKPEFAGEVWISGSFTEPSASLWLHAEKLKIASAGDLAPTQYEPDLVELRASEPLTGHHELHLTFTGAIDRVETAGVFAQHAGADDYAFTQLEAIYARRVFPCIDEPDVKVPWTLELDVPDKLVAVSNTPVDHEEAVAPGTKRVAFKQTKPLPSYLVAFAVGPFDIVDAGATKSGVPVRVVALKGRGPDAAYAAKTTPRILETLEDWFQIPYPYEKLDIVTVPLTVGFSAMENAGLVTYTERVILFDAKHASHGQEHGWSMVCAHELAHQWFGDFVTMAWWDDIWLNEGFANWMETKIIAKLEPGWHDELSELDGRDNALRADSLVSARRIRQPIATPGDILNVFDGITYSKGAAVLNMFESYVGAEAFQRGVRDYLHARAFGNATSADFVAAISRAAGKDLSAAFSTFLDQGGEPEVEWQVQCGGGGAKLALSQHRYVPVGSPAPPATTPWAIPVCIAYDKDGARGETCTVLDQPAAEVALAGKACPRWAMPNVHGHGYYRTAPTAVQVTALRDEAWGKLDWTERRNVVSDVVGLAEQSKLSLELALSFVPKLLAGGDRFTTGQAIGLPQTLAQHLPDDLRPKYAAWVRQTFGPAAAKVGLQAKDGEDLDAESMRAGLVGIVMGSGRDPALRAEAVKLADKWRDLPQSVRGMIVGVAADESADMFKRFLREAPGETERRKRGELLGAVAGVRDPGRQKEALALVLDTKIDLRETMWMLFGGATEGNAAAARAFFRDHQESIEARMPKSDTTGQALAFVRLFAATCEAGQREEIVGYIHKTFDALPGSTRAIAQSIEGMDQCIARRARLEPEVRGWLTGVKIPKPDKPKR